VAGSDEEISRLQEQLHGRDMAIQKLEAQLRLLAATSANGGNANNAEADSESPSNSPKLMQQCVTMSVCVCV
jgi:hypothetical protein